MYQSALLAFLILGPGQGNAGKQTLAAILDDQIRPTLAQISWDGKRLTIAGGTNIGGDWKVYDLSTGTCTLNGMDGKLRFMRARVGRLSNDNSLLALGGDGTGFYVVDAKTGLLSWNLTKETLEPESITGAWYTPDGKYLVAASTSTVLRVWDLKARRPHAAFRFLNPNGVDFAKKDPKTPIDVEIESYYGRLGGSVITPDGKTIAVSGSIHSKIPFFDIETGKMRKLMKVEGTWVGPIRFTADGKWLLVSTFDRQPADGAIEIWDLGKNALVKKVGKGAGQFDIAPDKKTLVVGTEDGFHVWDVETGKRKFAFFNKEDPRMPRVTIHGADLKRHVQHTPDPAGCGFLPDGKTFFIAPYFVLCHTEIYFHDTATGEPVDYRKRVAALPAR